MKKLILLLLAATPCVAAIAQKEVASAPKAAVKWAPAGLYFGSLNLQGEYRLNQRNSVTLKTALPLEKKYTQDYEGDDVTIGSRSTSFHAGYRHYLSRKKTMKGFYLEPYARYLQHELSGNGTTTLEDRDVTMEISNKYSSYGAGVQLGVQFLIRKRVAIDFYLLGPEVSSAKSSFLAVETTNALPWTELEAQDAETELRDLLEDLPIIGKNTTISVDRNNKSVKADFKGIMPGIRSGISIGIAF